MTVPGWCRVLRAGVFAAACVLLAALAHATMSGTPVPWWAMAAGATGTGMAGWLLAGRERGRTLIVAAVTAAQAVLHETFSLAQTLMPASPPDPTTMSHAAGSTGTNVVGTGSMTSMDMGSTAHTVHGMVGLGHMRDMVGMSGAASAGMFAAHLLAAILCGLWLAYGERAVFRVLRAAAAWLAAPLRLLLARPTPPFRPSVDRCRGTAAPAPARLLLLCSSLTFRGPPVGAAVI
ncbi:hypothetical protein ACWCP6_18525 [Streptomyces sp. NPDC002004]